MVVGREFDSVYMVMDYMDRDLKAMMSALPQPSPVFTQAGLRSRSGR